MIITCPHCNYSKDMGPDKIPDRVSKVTCPKCRQTFEFRSEESDSAFSFADDPAGTASGEGLAQRAGIPWESHFGGFLSDLFKTIFLVMFRPGTFFSRMPVRGGFKAPLTFGVMIASIGSVLTLFWQTLWSVFTGAQLYSLPALPMPVLMIIGLIIFLPFLMLAVTLGLFIQSAIIYLFLLLVRGGKNGYEATFRVLSYAQAVHILNILPVVGVFLGAFWILVVEIVGLSRAHETGVLRVLFAVLILPILIFGTIIALIVGAVWFLVFNFGA